LQQNDIYFNECERDNFLFFPEELDNKTFRLFVQRTWYLMQKGRVLSASEQEIAHLIQEHPEVGLYMNKDYVEIREQYPDNEYNPFLNLAALWEVEKQLQSDRPEGIRALVEEAFPDNYNENQVRARLALMYLELYQREHEGEDFNKTGYLAEIKKMINDPLYFEKFGAESQIQEEGETDKEDCFSQYYSNFFDRVFFSFQTSQYENASSIALNVNSKLQSCLSKLPTEWVNAIAMFWKRPAVRIKRERTKDIAIFLLDENSAANIAGKLSQTEKQVLRMILDNDGYVQYGKLERKFGSADEDGYWWTEKPPQSTIGKLRYKGLICVGKAPVKSRNYKIALIPKDLLQNIEACLEIDS